MKNRKLPPFYDVLEYRYSLQYKCMPFDTYTMLKSRGASREEAFDLVQEQMDDIWKEYRLEKQEEAKQHAFHSVPDSETPFHFTDKENDILNHLYQIQKEQPLFIPSDYDLPGKQLELTFT